MKDYVVDMLGKKFGMLTVISRNGSTDKWQALWLCRCDCGNTTTALGSHLRNGNTRSCGCLRKKNSVRHGMSGTPLHNTWLGIIKRTTQETFKDWKDYGGRGIKVCKEWEDSFEAFLADMGPTYEDGLTIDRIDVNGHYCKENCRWATTATQGHNKRKRENCSSKFVGVSWHKKTRKWSAYISINHKLEYLGEFSSELMAAMTYDNRSEDLYGDRPNGTTRTNDNWEILNA